MSTPFVDAMLLGHAGCCASRQAVRDRRPGYGAGTASQRHQHRKWITEPVQRFLAGRRLRQR